MNLSRRLGIAAACLALGVLGQLGLQAHLHQAITAPRPTLAAPLSEFPRELRQPLPADPGTTLTWQGEDDPKQAEYRGAVTFADELIFRRYLPVGPGPGARLYLVYSHVGQDREHHPESCLRDWAGLAEDLAGRETLFLDREHQRPAQRFRFHSGTGQYSTVYYWHYTLENPILPGQSLLQVLYQRLDHYQPGVTVQVSTSASPELLDGLEQSFLSAVDLALKKNHLPETSKVGCDRDPIRFPH